MVEQATRGDLLIQCSERPLWSVQTRWIWHGFDFCIFNFINLL